MFSRFYAFCGIYSLSSETWLNETRCFETQFEIVGLLQQGWTFGKIANTLKVNRQSAYSVCKAYFKDPIFSGISRCGKKSKVRGKEEKILVRNAKKGDRKHCIKLLQSD